MKQKQIMPKTMFLLVLSIIFLSQNIFGEFIVTTNQPAQSNTSTQFVVQTQTPQAAASPPNTYTVNQYQMKTDFNFYSTNQELNICSCSYFSDKIILQNTGNIADTYEIYSDKDYSRLSINKITLTPGEKIEIINYLSPGCDALSDDMTITITSLYGKTKELIQTVNVGVCDNLNLSIKNNAFKTYPCIPINGQLLLKNPLSFQEEYYLTSDFPRGEIQFFETNFSIPGKGQKQINFTYAPTCDVYGEVSGNINVKTENTELEESVPIFVNISKRYRYSLTVPKEFETCNYLYTWIPIKIRNNESFQNTFSLSIPKNSDFKLQNESVTLMPYEEKLVFITAHPILKNSGVSYINLSVTPTLGDALSKQIKVNVPNCYAYNVLNEPKQTLCSDDKTFDVKLQNSGTKNNIFIIDVEGLDEKFSKKAVIDTNKTLEIPVKLNLTDKNKKYNIKIKVSEDGYFNTTSKVKLNVKSVSECYLPQINMDKEIKADNSTKSINITLKNIGTKDAKYYLSLDAPNFTKLVKTSISIKKDESDIVLLKMLPTNTSEKSTASITLTESKTNTRYTKYFTINANEKPVSLSERIVLALNFAKNNIFVIGLIFLIVILVLVIIILGRVIYKKRQQKLDETRKLIMRPVRRR